MTMDPMMLQNMYLNSGFGLQGMGMNGMNMGVGDYGGGMGGQQSWNFGQDNFNHANAQGMGSGDYGNFNSRFQTGYNQGNYGHNYNDHRRNHINYRGRGRGRGFYGGYGRGGYQQGNSVYGDQSHYSNHQAEPAGPTPDNHAGSTTDEFGREIRAASETEHVQSADEPGGDDGAAKQGNGDADSGDQPDSKRDRSVKAPEASSRGEECGAPQHEGQMSLDGLNSHHSRHMSATSANGIPVVGASIKSTSTPIDNVPINAPTGPKAMRQGLPNTSVLNFRARGFQFPNNRESAVADDLRSHSARGGERRSRSRSSSSTTYSTRRDRRERRSSSAGHEYHGEEVREKDGDAKDDDYGRGRSRSRSESRSPRREHSRDRHRDKKGSRHHHSRRHRSQSYSSDTEYERRKKRSRKHGSRNEEDEVGHSRSREETLDEQSLSVDDKERSSHRSRRDKESKRHRDRDRDRRHDGDYEHHRKSGHRSHRDKNHDRKKDRHRDSDRERDRKKDRDREKDKSRDRDRHHESRHSSRRHEDASNDKTLRPDNDMDAAHEHRPISRKKSSISSRIRDPAIDQTQNSRRPSEASAPTLSRKPSTTSAPAKDPHTLEREARDRERLLKDVQRIAGLTGRGGMKRSRDAGDDGMNSRRKGRRSEVVSEDQGDRMRRLEQERERGRWT